MAEPNSRRYWDRRARENAMYFVDSGLDYRNPDQEAFWQGGIEVVDQILGSVGAEVHSSDRVLDIGCGVGRLTRALCARAGSVIGLDVSGEMLIRAKQLNEGLTNAEWIQGDGSSLQPIPDGSIDLCFSHVVFQHIPDPSVTMGYVREMGRVLRIGARACFVVSTDPAVHRQRPSLRHRVGSILGRAPRGGDDPAWLGSPVDVELLKTTATEAGLCIEQLLSPGTQYTTVYAIREK